MADEKVRLARKGLELIDAANPKKLKERIKDSAREAAEDVVLQGVETVGRWTGDPRSGDPGPKQEADVSGALDGMAASSLESFDARLRAAQADPKQQARAALRRDLANVRKTFPEPAKELALIVFSCVDLLGDLQDAAAGKKEINAEELARREKLLTKIATLLGPNAGDALTHFVDHVVQLSRRSRDA